MTYNIQLKLPGLTVPQRTMTLPPRLKPEPLHFGNNEEPEKPKLSLVKLALRDTWNILANHTPLSMFRRPLSMFRFVYDVLTHDPYANPAPGNKTEFEGKLNTFTMLLSGLSADSVQLTEGSDAPNTKQYRDFLYNKNTYRVTLGFNHQGKVLPSKVKEIWIKKSSRGATEEICIQKEETGTLLGYRKENQWHILQLKNGEFLSEMANQSLSKLLQQLDETVWSKPLPVSDDTWIYL